MILVELFGGTLALSRAALGGLHNGRPALPAPCSYMGAKNELAGDILACLRIAPGSGPQLIWNDGTTIGRVWGTLLGPEGAQVATRMQGWEGIPARQLWEQLRDAGEPAEDVPFAASWLWLQARAASGVPVWWSTSVVKRHRSGEGCETAYERSLVSNRLGTGSGDDPQPPMHAPGLAPPKLLLRDGEPATTKGGARGESTPSGVGGIQSPATIARRIRLLREAFACARWEGHHKDAREFASELLPRIRAAVRSGQRVVAYLDPPYEGATGYERGCSRADVLAMALELHSAGADVAISEAVPLPLGWPTERLPSRRKPEWLTISKLPPPLSERGALFSNISTRAA